MIFVYIMFFWIFVDIKNLLFEMDIIHFSRLRFILNQFWHYHNWNDGLNVSFSINDMDHLRISICSGNMIFQYFFHVHGRNNMISQESNHFQTLEYKLLSQDIKDFVHQCYIIWPYLIFCGVESARKFAILKSRFRNKKESRASTQFDQNSC